MSKRVVVVGHGMVGPRFIENAGRGFKRFSVTVLAEEPRLAYDRVNLTKYFSGSSVEDLTLTTREFSQERYRAAIPVTRWAGIDRATSVSHAKRR